MPTLGVNVDHVATIREARKIEYPDPVKAAVLCQKAGAESIVCHLREDRRHIQDKDLRRLKKILKVKLNLEMAMSDEIVEIALDVKPDQITLVPERRNELTTEGGLDVASRKKSIRAILDKMRKTGIGVSLFVDPDVRQIRASRETGAGMIELHTGSYANAVTKRRQQKEYGVLRRASELAREMALKVFAGHGLNYANTEPLTRIKEIEEYNIGHAIVARALFVGIEKAVSEMRALIK